MKQILLVEVTTFAALRCLAGLLYGAYRLRVL
jgi:hypothetical protein